MTDSTKSVSPLRQRMLDDMTMRKLKPKTQAGYLRAVKNFSRFFGHSPDLAEPEDLRRFQLHMVEQDISSITLNATITGLKFFFGVTLDRPSALKKMSPVRRAQKLPQVLSPDEVRRLLKAASNLKHRAALSVAYGAGLRASEVTHLKVADIDSERRIIRVQQGKGQRTATPCSHRHCSSCCGAGGGKLMLRGKYCKTVGCSRDKTRSSRSRPDNSTAPASSPLPRPAWTNVFPCTPCGTVLPRIF